MKFNQIVPVIALIVGMAFWSAPSSGIDGSNSCSCGGACNHVDTPAIIDSDFMLPILVTGGSSDVVITGGLLIMEGISGAANWCINSVCQALSWLREQRRSLNRYLLTGYWQELDYCPIYRDQKGGEMIQPTLISSPHQAFAMLLAWLKDRRIPHQSVKDYLECMNQSFPVLRLVKPLLSGEYQIEMAPYPITYLSRVINSFAKFVPYQTMIFVDNQFGHMVGIIQTGEQQFSVYFATINQRATVYSFKDLETIITRFYRYISQLWDTERNAKIVLIGIKR